jgi:hypothetical protein
MEIILGIAIIALVAYVFTRKKDVAEANADEAPYKTEAPVIVASEEPPVASAVEATVEIVPVADAVAPVVTAPAKKARAKKPAAEKKPRAKKAPKA